jgi:Domain of Unknown Function (DUF1206)
MTGRASIDMARDVEAAKREVNAWAEPAARIGHAAKGLVFTLTGVFVVAAQLGIGGDVDGPEAAFVALRGAPLGKLMLATIGIGLLYYAAWELWRAAADPEREAHGKILVRLEWLIGAVVFGVLSIAAFRVTFARAATRGDDVARTWASWAMADIPHGAIALGLVGALIVVGGAILIRRGWRADFERAMDLTGLAPASWAAIYAVARFGIIARGAVVATIGLFLVIAAWRHDPSEAIGIEGALRALGHLRSAPWLLGVVALGVASYGVYELLIAWKGRFYIQGA